MSEFDYGPVQTYEIVWRSGHVETVLAHQVTWPQNGTSLFGGSIAMMTGRAGTSQVQFHAMLDGRWRLTLAADEEDLRTIRLITTPESLPVVGEPS